MNRHANRTRFVCERSGDSLSNPPGGIGREPESLSRVELPSCPHQSHASFLDQIEERKSTICVSARNRNHQSQVRLDEPFTRALVTRTCRSSQFNFFFSGEQAVTSNFSQIRFGRIFRQRILFRSFEFFFLKRVLVRICRRALVRVPGVSKFIRKNNQLIIRVVVFPVFLVFDGDIALLSSSHGDTLGYLYVRSLCCCV
jgi:hypothetical protein